MIFIKALIDLMKVSIPKKNRQQQKLINKLTRLKN